ncbi:hypothetical protein GCM10010361_11020 [Streptomyces olivaceiscleroticus]|uniref:Tyr recombinase domain-containing protein n=1 Tax=Streptomyces olivaceiscleroticus TaxID=68245 RepID=A0ABP3JC95_9ACTN
MRRQLRWDIKGRPYFSLSKGRKTRDVPLPPNLAVRAREHFRRFPSIPCTLPWRNPEPPATALEERQRKPITVNLVLTTSHGNRIYYRTRNDRSWKPALAAAGIIEPVGETVRRDGGRVRRVPLYAAPREEMFHVLRHTYPSVQLEAGESIVSLSRWLGHSTPKATLDHYAHFMPGAGRRGLAVTDAWMEDRRQPKVPDESLLQGWPIRAAWRGSWMGRRSARWGRREPRPVLG